MSLLRKSNGRSSARRQIKIQEVRDNILVLPSNEYRCIIETSSINFELKSEAEQDAIIDNFQNFLNSLPCKLQILIRTRELDVNRYIEQILLKGETEQEQIYQKQISAYADFIQKLVSGNKILSRRFYIIIPYQKTDDKAAKNNDFSFVKEQLQLNQDIVIKGLERLGMKARPLDSLSILNLFYTFYNPEQSKVEEITKETIKNLMNQHYAF